MTPVSESVLVVLSHGVLILTWYGLAFMHASLCRHAFEGQVGNEYPKESQSFHILATMDHRQSDAILDQGSATVSPNLFVRPPPYKNSQCMLRHALT